MKRLVGIIVALSICFGLLPGCSKGKDVYEYTIRPVAETEVPDYTDKEVLPRPEGEVQSEIAYIDMNGCTWAELFLAESLQGNVNRTDPSMYVLHDYVIESSGSEYNARFWLDRLLETYTDGNGSPLYYGKEYDDLLEMVYDYRDKISGVVLYHDRLVDSMMGGKGVYGSVYSDIALLNLTVMMCAAENSVAVTESLYYSLAAFFAQKGEQMLPIKGDVTKFMRGTDGKLVPRNSSEVWTRVYEYALTHYAKSFSKMAVAHNPGFQPAMFDYYIQNKIFIYNRSLSTGLPGHASDKENEIEEAILGVSGHNTPVLGVWYLHLDESNFVNFITGMGKFMIVSYESFNWSLTRALPFETVDTGEDLDIELENDKIYLAFSFTEGDNNSYVQSTLAKHFSSESVGKYPFSWTISPASFEANPNIIHYLNLNWHEGDGLCIPEAGVDYVDPAPPAATAPGFYALTDEYIRRVGNGNIRTLQQDPVDALAYAENMTELDSMLIGYGIGNNTNRFNTENSDFLFRDTPYLLQFDGRTVYENMKLIEDTGTKFISISYSGWDHSPDDVVDLMETLDDRFVTVTQKQLAKLYRDYYLDNIVGVTKASFSPDMSRGEMAYLYKASRYSDYDGNENYRYADGRNYFIYRLRPSTDAVQAKLALSVSGDYSVEVSTDYLKWYRVAKGKTSEVSDVTVEIPSALLGNENLFVRFGDGTENDGGGVRLFHFDFMTEKATVNDVSINANTDAAYLAEHRGEITAAGRSGTIVYRFDFADGVDSADVSVGLGGPEETAALRVSDDGKKWRDVSLKKYGSSVYGKISGISGETYLKIETGGTVTGLKILGQTPKRGSVNFRPLGNSYDRAYMLSADEGELYVTPGDAASQARIIEDGEALVYRFSLSDGFGKARLSIELLGHYRISVSPDNVNYTVVRSVELGEAMPDLVQSFDITENVGANGDVYLKIDKSMESMSRVQVRKIRITTDKNESYLDGKIVKEQTPMPIIIPNTDTEKALIDASLSSDYDYYLSSGGYTTTIDPLRNGCVVYKLDFSTNNAEFWKELGLDLENNDLIGLGVVITVCNSYKLEISSDGRSWTSLAEETGLVINGTNKTNVRVTADDYLGNGVVYIRMSRGERYDGSHAAVLYQMRLSFTTRKK